MVSTYCARNGKDLFLKYHREPERMSWRSAVIAVLHQKISEMLWLARSVKIIHLLFKTHYLTEFSAPKVKGTSQSLFFLQEQVGKMYFK